MKLVMKKKVEVPAPGSAQVNNAALVNIDGKNPLDILLPSKRYAGKTIGYILNEKKDFSYLKWYYTQASNNNKIAYVALKQILDNNACQEFTDYMSNNDPEGLKRKFDMMPDKLAITTFLNQNKGRKKRDGDETFLSKMQAMLEKNGYLPDHLLKKVVFIMQTKGGNE